MSMGANFTTPYIQLVYLCVLLHHVKIKSLICELNSLIENIIVIVIVEIIALSFWCYVHLRTYTPPLHNGLVSTLYLLFLLKRHYLKLMNVSLDTVWCLPQ